MRLLVFSCKSRRSPGRWLATPVPGKPPSIGKKAMQQHHFFLGQLVHGVSNPAELADECVA
jgi:hypothetical protein